MLASLLKGSGLNELPAKDASPRNAMQFALLPTLGSLLEERANAGDVQTCVAICEVMQVIEPESTERTTTTRLPGLELSLVREWYLSYIGILHQMCLFSHASYLIGQCNDKSIGALNQQSTTYVLTLMCGCFLATMSTNISLTFCCSSLTESTKLAPTVASQSSPATVVTVPSFLRDEFVAVVVDESDSVFSAMSQSLAFTFGALDAVSLRFHLLLLVIFICFLLAHFLQI